MGGLFNGLFLGFFFLLQTRYTRQGIEKEFRVRHIFLRIFGLLVAILGSMIMLIVLYTQTNPAAHWCDWCESVNCAPINAFWFCDASGCSDDDTVRGTQFKNGTIVVDCPSFIGKNVSAVLLTPATPLDVVQICRNQCFPP